MLLQFRDTHHHDTCRQQANVQMSYWWLRSIVHDEKRSHETPCKRAFVSAFYLILEIPLVLYRFSEPVVRVERKNPLNHIKTLWIHFPARSKLHRFSRSFRSRYQAFAISVDMFFLFSFPGQFMLASVLNVFCVSIWHRHISKTFNLKRKGNTPR